MLSIFTRYDYWAKSARLLGLNEWPEPGEHDTWTGKDGNQYGRWYADFKFGVLCLTPVEFAQWEYEGDLPENYVETDFTNHGSTHNFVPRDSL